MDIYNFTLINFQGEVLGYVYYGFEEFQYAIAHAGKLIWKIDECARVIVESDSGFHMTVEWGVRKSY